MRSSDWSSDMCSSELTRGVCSGSGPSSKVRYSRLPLDGSRVITSRDGSSPRRRDLRDLGCTVMPCGVSLSDGCAQDAIQPGDVVVPGEPAGVAGDRRGLPRSEEHTSELQSLMRISYAVFCLKKKKKNNKRNNTEAEIDRNILSTNEDYKYKHTTVNRCKD